MRRQYRKKKREFVVAIRLDLQTDGLRYYKWGALQHAKRGDWLVENNGDVYSIDARTFARTYTPRSHGRYEKTTPVWAEAATAPGNVRTKEGTTRYRKGDYIVSNNRSGRDSYAVSKKKFELMYRAVR